MSEGNVVGCLLVDDPRLGENALSGLSCGELREYPFEWTAGEGALSKLQTLLQTARREHGQAVVLARGLGCGAALALSEQLPVERLALVAPELAFRTRGDARLKEARRLCDFARRNLSLCVSDALVVEGMEGRGWRKLRDGGLAAHGRLLRLAVEGETREILYTFCENSLKRPITHFLRTGELPKKLAENEEMCIIWVRLFLGI